MFSEEMSPKFARIKAQNIFGKGFFLSVSFRHFDMPRNQWKITIFGWLEANWARTIRAQCGIVASEF